MPRTVGDLRRALRGVPDSTELELRVLHDGYVHEYNVGEMFDSGAEFVIRADPEDTDAYERTFPLEGEDEALAKAKDSGLDLDEDTFRRDFRRFDGIA